MTSNPSEPPAGSGFATYASMKDIIGQPVPPDELIRNYAELNWHGTLLEIGKLSAAMTNAALYPHQPPTDQCSKLLAPLRFAPDAIRHHIGKFFHNHPGKLVFSPQGLLVAASMAILYGSEKGVTPEPLGLALLCLVTNDYISRYRASSTDDLDTLLAQLAYSYKFKDTGHIQETFARAHGIYSTLPQNPRTAGKRPQLEQSAFGGSFEKYFSAFAFPLVLSSASWGKDVPPTISPTTWSMKTQVDQAWAELNFAPLLATRSELMHRLRQNLSNGIPLAADVVLARSPLIRVDESGAVCISPQLLREQLRLGLWARFRAAYIAEFGQSGGEKWQRDFGIMFERWCRTFAERAAAEANCPVKVELSADIGSADELEDIILEDPDDIAFISCKGALIRERARLREDTADLVAWVAQFFFGDNSRAGALTLLEKKRERILERAAGKRIHLVVVSYDTIGDSPALRAWIDRELKARSILNDPSIRSVRALSVVEFERLLALTSAQRNPLEVLRACSEDRYRGVAIDWVIYETFGEVARPKWILDLIGDYGNQTMLSLYGRPLRSRPPIEGPSNSSPSSQASTTTDTQADDSSPPDT